MGNGFSICFKKPIYGIDLGAKKIHKMQQLLLRKNNIT